METPQHVVRPHTRLLYHWAGSMSTARGRQRQTTQTPQCSKWILAFPALTRGALIDPCCGNAGSSASNHGAVRWSCQRGSRHPSRGHVATPRQEERPGPHHRIRPPPALPWPRVSHPCPHGSRSAVGVPTLAGPRASRSMAGPAGRCWRCTGRRAGVLRLHRKVPWGSGAHNYG